jgi:competence protein ComEA
VAARVPVRLDPGRRAALAVGLAVVVAAIVTGLWVLAERPRALAVASTPPPIPGASSPVGTGVPRADPGSPAGPGSSPAGSPSAPASSEVVVVDVAGKVRHPGLYRLPAGARVDDAVRAAGGRLAGVDLSSLNLAARVVDGQQILVGIRGAAPGGVVGGAPGGGGGVGGVVPSPSPGGSAPGGSAGTPVDLNSATLEQLETLPGVGPVLGQHILDWRTAHGRFTTVDQLDDVTGIGDVKFAALRPLVTV